MHITCQCRARLTGVGRWEYRVPYQLTCCPADELQCWVFDNGEVEEHWAIDSSSHSCNSKHTPSECPHREVCLLPRQPQLIVAAGRMLPRECKPCG